MNYSAPSFVSPYTCEPCDPPNSSWSFLRSRTLRRPESQVDHRELRLPSSAEEGWLREVRTPRSVHSRADGVVLVRSTKIALPTLPRPLHQRWLRRFLFDVSATPPQLRRGTRAPTPRLDETPCRSYRYAFARISHSQFWTAVHPRRGGAGQQQPCRLLGSVLFGHQEM